MTGEGDMAGMEGPLAETVGGLSGNCARRFASKLKVRAAWLPSIDRGDIASILAQHARAEFSSCAR